MVVTASGKSTSGRRGITTRNKRKNQRDWNLFVGISVIWAISLTMRLCFLGSLEPPVFDEIYFTSFAEQYLNGIASFDVHPPLGKYAIALGIPLFGRNAIGYRISTAIAGSFIPVVVAGLAYKLTYRRQYALTAGGLMLAEGLFLVESRFGLMNVWLVLFGLTAHIFAIAGLERSGWTRLGLLTCCGSLLGACASVKWNGLGFALGLGGVGAIALGLPGISAICRQRWGFPLTPQRINERLGIWQQVHSLRWWHYSICFGLAPLAVYVLQWLPHLWMLSDDSYHSFGGVFLQLKDIHLQMLGGHASATSPSGAASPIHPYCSPWWSWPLMGRPIGYFFEDQGEVWRDVHAIGNPVLWWSSTMAIATLAISVPSRFSGTIAYLLVCYFANFLPWIFVSRCLFLYHYMASLLFSIMALALGLERGLSHPRKWMRWLGVNLAFAILAGGIFYIPIWMGIPLSPNEFYQRMWFRGDWLPGFNWI